MNFFLPHAEDEASAESNYRAIAQFISAPIQERRIWKLKWRHNGMQMECEVGRPLPPYYQLGDEQVIAIFDSGSVYMICTASRGVLRGSPVLAGHDFHSHPTYFDAPGRDEPPVENPVS